MSTAVVLGGSAITGTAWQAGLIVGLAQRGFYVAEADLLLCTSSAAPLGAKLAMGIDPERAAQGWLAMDDAPPLGHDAKASYRALFDALVACDGRPAVLGRLALDAETMSEADHIASMGPDILGATDWPTNFACTAVDVYSGERQVFDRSGMAGGDLGRAVAASCALPVIRPPVALRDHVYMDGGAISGTHADLAWPHDGVIIITAIRDQAPAIRERKRQDEEISGLRGLGCKVRLVTPDAASLDAIGPNTMAAGNCRVAYANGVRQGKLCAPAMIERFASPRTRRGVEV